MKVTKLKVLFLVAAVAAATSAVAGPIGYGAATTGGGSKAPVNVATLADAQAKINADTENSALD